MFTALSSLLHPNVIQIHSAILIKCYVWSREYLPFWLNQSYKRLLLTVLSSLISSHFLLLSYTIPLSSVTDPFSICRGKALTWMERPQCLLWVEFWTFWSSWNIWPVWGYRYCMVSGDGEGKAVLQACTCKLHWGVINFVASKLYCSWGIWIFDFLTREGLSVSQ